MRRAWTLLLLVACMAAPADTTPTTEPVDVIRGTLLLREPAGDPPAACAGKGGFDDIAGGAPVIIRDETGTIVATTRLSPGYPVLAFEGARLNYCKFDFVAEVPSKPFYTVEVSHRGELTYSAAELEAAGWRVELELG